MIVYIALKHDLKVIKILFVLCYANA